MANQGSSVHVAHSGFKKGKVMCPVCHREHRWHCSVTKDDSLALCRYVWSDKQAQDGRYIHVLTNRHHNTPMRLTGIAPTKFDSRSVKEQRADAERLDTVYRALLSNLPL